MQPLTRFTKIYFNLNSCIIFIRIARIIVFFKCNCKFFFDMKDERLRLIFPLSDRIIIPHIAEKVMLFFCFATDALFYFIVSTIRGYNDNSFSIYSKNWKNYSGFHTTEPNHLRSTWLESQKIVFICTSYGYLELFSIFFFKYTVFNFCILCHFPICDGLVNRLILPACDVNAFFGFLVLQ